MSDFDLSKIGQEMHGLIRELYPICSSITGNGLRERLKIIKGYVPIKIYEIASGTRAFDWTVPKEWNIKDAYIKNSKGGKIVDFKKSNLHVLNYSVPVNKKMDLTELKKHLFTLPEYPDRIPYRTSYYEEKWGFCLSHKQYEQLEEDTYEVVIDSTLEDGSLTYGELFLPGKIDEEVLFSCYLCHPSMCNDSLSGVAIAVFLAKQLLSSEHKYSYRFLFIPETIGSIVWLNLNENNAKKIKHGLVITCVGDAGSLTYKRSRIGQAMIDMITEKVLKDSGEAYNIIDFFPTGSDERQFCSPGFNLPIGSLMRTPYNRFSEYHTSADNLDFCQSEHLADSLDKYIKVVYTLENNAVYVNLNPKGEPQLGVRGLYEVGGSKNMDRSVLLEAVLWILNLSDGKNSLLDIAIRSGLAFEQIKNTADILLAKNLIK